MAKAKAQKAQESGAGIGDTVLVRANGAEHKGMLLPSNNPQTVAIKLSSGYNIGISKESAGKLEVLEKGAPPSSAAKVRAQPEPKKDFTSILGCGGTIASRIDYKTGAVDAAISPQELVSSFSHLSQKPLRAKSLFSISSEDTTPSHWQEIAKAVAGEIKDGAQGVVITHGTDTLSFTSAALCFMLRNLPVPVILTGSQRSSDRSSSDAQENMAASLLAAEADLSGVYACMHESMSDGICSLHFGAKVRKMHTSRRDAFRSINCTPAARVILSQKKVETTSQLAAPRKPGAKLELDAKLNPNVALIYSFPGMKPELITSLSKYDGVVIAGTGLGHVPSNSTGAKGCSPILPAISELIASGIPVAVAPQTIYGRINLNVYSTGRMMREAGVIGHLCDFTPEAAYAKLMWVLAREKKMDGIRALMEKNVAGEISGRSEIVDFDF